MRFLRSGLRARLLLLAIALAATTLILFAVAHTPPVRARVRTWAIGWLYSQAGIVASIDDLSYNLLTLDIRLDGVRLSADGSATPFASARRVHLDVPWSAVFGALRLHSVELDEPAIELVRDAQGSLNLPQSSGGEGGTGLERLTIERVGINRARVRYDDAAAGMGALVDGITVRLSRRTEGTIEGPLTVERGLSVQAGGVAVNGAIDGGLSYDGQSIALNAIGLAMPQGRLVFDGRVGIFGSSPRVQLSLAGVLRFEEAAALLGMESPPTGLVSVSGAVDGPVAAPAASLMVTAPAIGWRHLDITNVELALRANGDGGSLERGTANVAGGTLTAAGRLPFDTMRLTATTEARDVDAGILAAPLIPAALAARLNARAELDANLTGGIDTLLADLNASAEIRASATPGAPRSIGLDGDAALRSTNGVWRARHDLTLGRAIRFAGVLDGRFAGSVGEGRVAGRVNASADDPAALLRLLHALDVSTPDWLQPIAGRIDAQVAVSGRLGDPTARGRAVIDGLQFGDLRPIHADAELALSSRGAAFDALRATVGRNELTGSGSVDLSSGALRGHLEADVSDFAAFGPWITAWRPAGEFRLQVDANGTRLRPRASASISGSSLRAAQQDLGTVTAELTYANDVVAATSVELRQPDGGRLSASGDYAVTTRRHALTLRTDAVRITPIETDAGAWPVAATVDGTLTSRGTLDAPQGGGRFTVQELLWDGIRVDTANAGLTLAPAGVTLNVTAPSFAVTASAVLVPRPPYRFTVDATADGTTAAALVQAAGERAPPALERLTGAFSARIKAAGTLDDVASVSAEGALEQLTVQMDDARLELDRPAAARYTASTLAVNGLRLRTGGTTIDVTGEISPTSSSGLTLAVTGALGDVRPWLSGAGLPAGFAMDGALSVGLRAAGTMERLALGADARLDNARISWPGYPAVTGIAARLTLADGVVDVPALTANWQEIAATSQLRVPLAFLSRWLPDAITSGLTAAGRPATLSARLTNVTPAAAAPFVDTATLDVLQGHAALDVALSADEPVLERITGEVIVTELSATAVNVPIEQMQPTHLALEDGRLRVVGWTWNVAGSHIGVSGSAGLTGDRALDLRADGRLDLRILGVFAPSITTSGTGDLAVAVAGIAAEPRAAGTISLENAELRLAEPQVGITDAAGVITLGPNRLDVDRLGGSLNGGRFAVRGGVDYNGLTATGGELTLDVDGVALDVPEGFRTQLDARLRAAIGDRIALTGRVDVIRGAYREPISLAAIVADAARRRDLAAAPEEDTLARRVDLDVAVTSSEDLILDNNYGRMDLGLDVRLVGTAAAPSVVGRAAVREGGVLFLGGRTYLVERGVIDFSDPRTIVPELDLSARTRIRGTDEANAPTDYDVTLGITGTPDKVETALTSDPPRSQADIVSLLATGRLADQAGGAGTAVARDQVLGYLSGEAFGFAARAVGLDSIRFEQGANLDALQADPSIAGEVNPAQRLTLSRRVSRFVEVTVSQNLRDTGLLTWIVTYAPRRAVEVRTVSRDDRSRSYELRHDLSFGGPPAVRGERAAAPSIRVGDVRLTGNLAVPSTQLTRRLGLRTGQRFDFYRWQQDRDRLRRFYLDRGFFEARIAARQIPQTGPSGGPRVDLAYHVEPGPQTSIVVDGYRLPDTTLRELETAWSDAVVAVALLDDLRSAVARHLAEEGYLQAAVRVDRQNGTDASSVIHVQIDPGSRMTARTLRVEGNRQISTLAIDTLALRHGIDAWLRPKALADDLAAEYRQLGLLNATVAAGPITIEQNTAILPIRIDEGPTFQIAGVRIEGAAGRTEDAARTALGLAADTPYRPDEVEQARRRLQRAYASDGYTTMSDTVRTSVDRARGTVDLLVSIDEGPRQVVERIAVDGGDDVGQRVVTQALGVSAGDPVDPDAWNASRRRVLQTGLFRRVDFTAIPLPGVTAAPGVEPVRLDVTVVRRTPWRLRYGIDVTDENGPLAERGRVFGGGVNANLERFGLFGRPGTAGLSLRYNSDRRVARGVVTWPSLFGRPLASRLYVSRSRDSVEGENILAFITDKTVVTAEQRFQPIARTQIAYAYQFERNHVFDPSPDPDDPFAIDERWRQARITASLIVDTRNDPLDPRNGLLHSSNMEYGLEVLGRNGRFIKYSAQQFVFRELLPGLFPGAAAGIVSASGARMSLGRGFGQDLILSERFYAGGANTVRGYPEDALAGLDFFGEPIPGQAIIVLNQEVRFPIHRWVRGVAFVDAGNVFTRVDDLSLRSLKVGTGFGLRFATPLGLLRLDVAAPLPRDGRPFKYSFAFGHIF
jgi:outer membrane protein assembly factor BamA/autotransporter translocation and assembly factor TamB